jgi:polysaccharide biosynthesis transport protein
VKLSLFLWILYSRRRLICYVVLGVVGVAAVMTALTPKTYVASTSLVVDSRSPDAVSGQVRPEQPLAAVMATQSDIVSSHNVALKVVDLLDLTARPDFSKGRYRGAAGEETQRDRLAEQLLRGLQVKPSRESSVLSIDYASSNPATAAEIANAFAKTYIDTLVELRVEPARQSAVWYDEQLKVLRAHLQRSQADLSTYQARTGMINVDERLDEETARLSGISSQLVTAQSQASETGSRQRQLEPSRRADALSDVSRNPVVQGLKVDLARADAKFAELSERLEPNHPQYQRAQTEVRTLRMRLNSEVRTASDGIVTEARIARQHEADLTAALEHQKAKLMQHRQARDGMLALTREVESAQRAYDTALQRLGETRLESLSNQTNVTVLNRAVPPERPSKPRMGMNLAIAAFFGTLLALSVATVLELRELRHSWS